MIFHSPLHGFHFEHTADVYSIATELKGHVEVDKDPLYTSIPCYGYKVSNSLAKLLLGDTMIDRYKIIFPLTFSDSDVVIGEHYKVHLTKDGVTKKFEVESVTKFPTSHIECDVKEDNL